MAEWTTCAQQTEPRHDLHLQVLLRVGSILVWWETNVEGVDAVCDGIDNLVT
jgi:hypothetical protein